MDTLVKFTSQYQGKDRVFRAAQFACALSTFLLRSSSDTKDLVAKLKSLERSLSSGRKVYRLGNTMNSVEAVKRSLSVCDPVLSVCLTVVNTSRALYFIWDNVLWAINSGLIRDLDKTAWSTGASRWYLLSLLLSLSRDVYVLLRSMTQRAKDRRFRQLKEAVEAEEVGEVLLPPLDAVLLLLLETLKSHPAVALDTLKNICDLFIPLDKLGIYPSNAGKVALCGLVSSLIGILTYVKPTLSLKP